MSSLLMLTGRQGEVIVDYSRHILLISRKCNYYRFYWLQNENRTGESLAEIHWEVPMDQQAGTYKINHMRHYLPDVNDTVFYFEGESNPFQIA